MTVPPFLLSLPLKLIANKAKEHRLDWELIACMVSVESMGNRFATKYEPTYRWINRPSMYANTLGISRITEETHQKTSWGLGQLMGGLCRDLGFNRHLPELTDPALNLEYMCRFVRTLSTKYGDEERVIAAYNAGSPRKLPGGLFVNQGHVDKVCSKLHELRDIS